MTNRMMLLCSVALIGGNLPGVVAAQDSFSWNGAFIGADVGLGIGSTQRDNIQSPPDELDEGALGGSGLVGGVFAGYDIEVAPGLVFGIEAGLDFFNAEASLTDATYADDYEFRSLGAAYAGVRAGATIAPRTLLYGRLAYAAIYSEASDIPAFDPGNEFLNGYQVAVGLESEVAENVTLRVEGTYTSAVDRFITGDPDTYAYSPTHFGAQAGVAYRFGGDDRGERAALASTGSWSGVYVGILGGGLATSSLNGGMDNLQGTGTEGPASTIVPSYGAYIGLNHEVGGGWVVGVEGEGTMYEAAYDAIGPAVAGAYDYASSDHKAQVSARLGFLVNPDTLVYGRAGYGLMHINPDYDMAEDSTESAYIQAASAGVGVEAMVNQHALIRVEALYTTALEEYRFADDASVPSMPFYVKPESVEARVGAAFKF